MTKILRKEKARAYWLGVLALSAVVALVSCSTTGTSSSSGTSDGAVIVKITDAAAYGYNNVWITVKSFWFHTSDAAGPGDSAWLKYDVTPYTVDLLALSNGTLSTAIWDNIKLPVGTYKQIRLLLAGTADILTPSASAQGLNYNNEVVDAAGAHPLWIPDYSHGIRLAGTFTVTTSSTLNLAIDFDAGDDIVDITRKGVTEYFLKPRLAYFDLDNAGAIVGTIDLAAAGNNATAEFVFKAEAPNEDTTPAEYHVVKRATVYDTTNNQFVLYPLAPGNYDVILRGIGYETVIVKNVPVTKGTTPSSGATVIPTITMTPGSDYTVTADDGVLTPTGSWINFYQTLPLAGELPYEVRTRNLNPFTGGFKSFKLSSSAIQSGPYVDGTTPITLTEYTPAEGAGAFQAVQLATLYNRSASVLVTPTSNTDLATAGFTALTPSTPAAYSISGTIVVPSELQNKMDSGKLYIVFGGMILNTIDVGSQMVTGGAYSMSNLPGGVAYAIYGVDAIGWSSTTSTKAVGVPAIANLSTGNATGIDLSML
jgi:hypothetical protein